MAFKIRFLNFIAKCSKTGRCTCVLAIVTIISAFLASGCASTPQAASSFADAQRLFESQPKNAAAFAYSDAWVDFNNTQRLDERDGCYFKAEGPLVQILQMDASGKVVGYFSDNDNGRSRCWRSTFLGVTFPKPPFAPFYYLMEMQ